MSGPAQVEKRINQVILGLKRGRIAGSYSVSKHTADILRMVVGMTKWNNAKSLIESIKAVELAIVNTVRRVLHIIRDEYTNSQFEVEEEEVRKSQVAANPSLASVPSFLRQSSSSLLMTSGAPMTPSSGTPRSFLTSSTSGALLSPTSPTGGGGGGGGASSLAVSSDSLLRRPSQRLLDVAASSPSLLKVLAEDEKSTQEDFSKSYSNLKSAIMEAVQELIDELSSLYRHIADQAIEHVHANEIIMTFGKSRTVEDFLKTAARKRRFEVFVAESAPSNAGQEMAASLSAAGIETTLITDSAIFAIMARVNKVIVGTHAVMANGGLVAQTGIHMLAQAAKLHSVPFVVCTGLYKLCPLYPHDQDTFNELRSPSEILKPQQIQQFTNQQVSALNPAWDYVPPELVSLYITNSGGHNPSYIYRLLAEYYHPEDMDL